MVAKNVNVINLQDDWPEFYIDNDPNRAIKFNPSDENIVSRLYEAKNNIETGIEKIQSETKIDFEVDSNVEPIDKFENSANIIKKIDTLIREQTNYVFGYPVADAVYGITNPMSTRNGVTYFERFFNAVAPIIEKTIKAEHEAAAKRMEKYTDKWKPSKK